MKTLLTIILLALLPVAMSAQAKGVIVHKQTTSKTTSYKVVCLKNKEFKCVLIAVMYIRVYPNIQPVPQELKDMPDEDSQLTPPHEASMQIVHNNQQPETKLAMLQPKSKETQH